MSSGPERALSDFERALGKLVPQAPNLQRDRLLFSAGKVRGRRLSRVYLAGNVMLVGVCLFLGYQLLVRPVPRTVTHIVVEREPRSFSNEPTAKPAEESDTLSPSFAAPSPLLSGSENPPPYGTIQRNMPYFGDRALPYLVPSTGLPREKEEERVGSRPGLTESFLHSIPWR